MAAPIRPMNIIEKIIAHHAIGLSRPSVAPGEAVCVRVDWTMANELTLVGINDMYTKIGRPGVANKERVVRCGTAPRAPPPSPPPPAVPAAGPPPTPRAAPSPRPPITAPAAPSPVARGGPHRGPPQLPRAQALRADQAGG